MSDTTNMLEENFKKSMDKTHKCARTTCRAICPSAQRCHGSRAIERERTVIDRTASTRRENTVV